MSLFWLSCSLYVNFFSQYPIPLYKRIKMSGQSSLKGEVLKKYTLVTPITARGYLINHESRADMQKDEIIICLAFGD